ncbi:MAG: cyanophycin synthetase [Firmicutes bacterium]|nr:cyanophycin synthetase [Bacillota bacterium]
MDIIQFRFFSGPNRHVLAPAAEVLLDLGTYSNCPTSERPTFLDDLLTVVPGIQAHHCSLGYRGGFVERVREGTYLGHVVEHVALELLYLGGERGVYGKTRQVSDQIVRVVFQTESEAGGKDAVESAISLVRGLWNGQALTLLTQAVEAFTVRLADVRLGPSTAALCQAARARQIPMQRLDDHNLIRFGQGKNQHRMMATTTDRTSLSAIEIAQDKCLTKRLLEAAGTPVPQGKVVRTADEATTWAEQLGYPVVLKPLRGHHGQGVSVHLQAPEEVRRAFEFAQGYDSEVMVEREISGTVIRMLVVGNRMVAASERVPPAVTGDGVHTVSQLVEILNQDPKRGHGHSKSLTKVDLDGPAILFLSQQQIYPDTVLAPGQHICLRASANMSTGAWAKDVTKHIAPDLATEVVRAASQVGLDVAGVDVITRDPGLSLIDSGGAVIEINAAPGLRMHLDPSEGAPVPVAEAILDWLFGDSDGRVPVAAVTGTNGKTTVTRMLAHILAADGKVVGMATTDGIKIGSTAICAGDLTGPWSARLVLNDPAVEAACLETARGGMARGGLGFDDCDVAVVTNIGSDHLGQDGIDTIDDLVHLKSLIVDVVRPSGAAVLNADDPLVLGMAGRCRGEVILFSAREESPELFQHLDRGGRAVYVKRGHLVYSGPDQHYRLVGCRVLPSSLGGMATINVANAAAAAAAALALGMSPRQVGKALAHFPAAGEGMNRGRLEMLSGPDLRVLIDYGHNRPAMTALATLCRRLRARPVVTVLGLPGDRRDQDLIDTAGQVAEFSQRVVVREDDDLRGRRPGEVADLIRQGLITANMPADAIEIELDEGAAVSRAILSSPPGGLVLVLYERYGVVRKAAQEALNLRPQALRSEEEIHASG